MKLHKIALGFTLICFNAYFTAPFSALAADHLCRFTANPQSIKASWTAFKTTEKTPVSGTLKDLKFTVPSKGVKGLKGFLFATKATGQVDSATKSDTGNPARDQTLYDKFFALIAAKGKFEGSFTDLKGSDEAGDANLQLFLNGKKKSVPMKYTLSAEGKFEAKGEFDMVENFAMSEAYASIHKACEALHTGKDGVSKTWSTVGIVISATLLKDCRKK